MSQPDTTSAELGKRKRAPPPSPFSAWKPGDAAMQSQRKKKQRDKEEKKKEAARIAKLLNQTFVLDAINICNICRHALSGVMR